MKLFHTAHLTLAGHDYCNLVQSKLTLAAARPFVHTEEAGSALVVFSP